MKTGSLPLLAVLMLACAPWAAAAESATPLPAPAAASAPAATKPGPRTLTPTELRESAAAPGDLRPERRATPQISIPLGKSPPGGSKMTLPTLRHRAAASSPSGIDDGAARCEAQSDAQLRTACRDKLVHEAGIRKPD